MRASCHLRSFVGWALLCGLSACGAVESDPRSAEVLTRPASEVTVSVDVDRATFGASDNVALRLTFRNAGTQPARLLSWNTAAIELEEDLFSVRREDNPVQFIGPHYKRAAPVESDYVTIAPGASLTRIVDLSSAYDFSQSGTYYIRYRQPDSTLASDAVNVWVEGRNVVNPGSEIDSAPQLVSGVSFSKCTSSQQLDILDAVDAARSISGDAVSSLSGSPSATPRYTKWFGTFSSAAWDDVKSHFLAIKEAFDDENVTVDCSCKKTYFAYVYPGQPYKIYVCKAFWSAPMNGTDSKGGTLVHEMSHFNVVASTDDRAYGQRDAAALASSNPAGARGNADNHEYFAENDPTLP